MKFDDRYEHIQMGFRDNKVGVIRGISKQICSQCRKKTYWIYYNKAKGYKTDHICSEECLEKLERRKNEK